jgi:hypothetical protein
MEQSQNESLKKKIIAMLIAAILILLLPLTIANAQANNGLTQKDCSLIFPRTDDCQSSKDEAGEKYCTAWYRGYADDTDEFQGYVFLKSLPLEDKDLKLLVGVTEFGEIVSVKSRGNNSINQEFLSQFRGKTFDNSFEIARTLEDLLYIPSKIKAMDRNIQTSHKISNMVKDVLNSVKKLNIYQ